METNKLTAKQFIEVNLERVKKMNLAELTKLGCEKFNSRAGFSAYKKALLAVAGIDYNSLRTARREEKIEQLQTAAKKSITLVTDATAERFAICDSGGQPLWYGRFFDGEGGEQSAGELAAAKKAIWLASKIKEAIGEAAITLILQTDAEWLTWGEFSADSKRGGKARILGEMAVKFGIDLKIEHIAGISNPADYYSRTHGFKKWSDNNLQTLAIAV